MKAAGVKRLITVTGLGGQFRIYSTVEEALSEL